MPTHDHHTTPPPWSDRLRRLEQVVPAFAVGLIAVTAVATAVKVSRHEAPQPAAAQAGALAAQSGTVVQAPPLKAPLKPSAPSELKEAQPGTNPGAAPACRNCGVVEMVVAVHGYAQPRASGYQMHIRMDDGSVRTVEQRGALAAGSRVIVERQSIRVLAGQG